MVIFHSYVSLPEGTGPLHQTIGSPLAGPYDSPPYADEALPIRIQRGDAKIKRSVTF